MTYPQQGQGNPNGLTSVGVFSQEGKEYDDLRARLAAYAEAWFSKCQNDRVGVERQWYLNLAYYYGNQHVQFRRTSGNSPFDLYTPPAPYYRVRIVINQIRKIIRKEIARLVAQKPNAFVVPSSTEDGDVFAAQAAEQIWESLWRDKNFNKVLRRAVFWKATCGVGFVKSYWDPTKVDKHNPDQAGDICIEPISPFYIFVPELTIEEIEDQPYIIHAQVRNTAWIKANWGVDAADNRYSSVDDQLLAVQGTNRNASKKETAIVLEVWVKPGYIPELPQGGMFTVAGGQIVQGFDSWPYDHGQYPFAKIDGMPTGKFYPSSVVEDLIPIQKELNRTRAQLIEAKNKTSKPQLVAEEGSVDPKRITTEPGQVVLYKVGFQPPTPLPLQNLPPYVTEEIDRLYTDLQDLSGQHEVSNGSTPPGVTAATAISFLQEQDESLIAPEYQSLEEAIEKIATLSLVYVKMYWDEKRTVKVTGLNGSFDVMTFQSADLHGNTDIRVESGSSLPTSRAAKQAFIMDLMKMGFVEPNKGLELMEVGGLASIYEQIQVDKRQAQRENLKMRVVTPEMQQKHEEAWMLEQQANMDRTKDIDAGMNLVPPLMVPVHTYDNHQVHIEIHNQYRKSQAFETAPPEVQALFEEHVRQHQEAEMGMLTHPLTGMSDTNPNAAPMGEEEAVEQEMMEEEESSPTGPEPMPQLEGEMAEGEMG